MKKSPILLSFLLIVSAALVLLALSFTACTDPGAQDETSDDTSPAVSSDTETVASSDAEPAGSGTTSEDTEQTQSETSDEETETITEEETDMSAENIPSVNYRLTFHADDNLSSYLTFENCEGVICYDDEFGSVLKVTCGKSAPKIVFKVGEYLNLHGLDGLAPQDSKYIVFTLKTDNFTGGKFMLSSLQAKDSKPQNLRQKINYDDTATGWQQLVGSLKIESANNLDSVTFNPFSNAGDVIYLREISICGSIAKMADCLENLAEYRLGSKTDMTVVDSDPIEHAKIAAPDEDDTVKFAFDHITEKKAIDDTDLSDRVGYTMRMAKNEIQSCQFFLAPETDRSFRVELSDFTDENGNKLETSMFCEFYHAVNGRYLPDALPPLASGGVVTVLGGHSQGFVIKAKTTADTVAGTYKAIVNIYDNGSSKLIKTAEVYTVVWNFTLSDETACEVVTGLSPYSIYNVVSAEQQQNIEQVYINYYDWLLDNRINGYSLPVSWNDERAVAYYNNPRVRRFKIDDVNAYPYLAEHPEWAKKGYFYIVDEPTDNSKMDSLMTSGDQLNTYCPGYHMVSPFFTDITYKGDDQITSMAKVCDIWCVKPFAYTPRALSSFSGTQYLQNEKQDAQYGTFAERMEKEMKDGDTVWTYVCWEPEEPYANWMINDDGTQTVVSMWQCKMLGINGMLYWSCCYWDSSNLFGYGNVVTAPNGQTPVWGDGVLIYSGSPFGLDTPVSSLRLEGVRDGVEDYEYLTMLEKVCGKEVADEYISLITTSVVTFTEDDDRIAAVRSMLGDRLEAELNK